MKKNILPWRAALFACVALPVIVLAQQLPDRVEAPAIGVGDNWTFQYFDVWKNVKGNRTRQEVTAVADDGISIDAKRLNDGRITHLKFSRELNPMDRGNMRFAPFYARYAFPLVPGKTWERDATGNNPAENKTWRYQFKGKVEGWEKVKVQAGEFDALKVTVEAYYQGTEINGPRGSGKLTETLWYAPAVKTFVKQEYQDTDWMGKVYNRDKWELTAFSVK
jgi:hypothetical protein